MDWQMQQAKQRFSEVIRLSKNGPQRITKGGEEAAWIISSEEYRRLRKHKDSLVDFFQKSPHRDVKLKIKRRKDLPRKIVL